jgi:hypothetical protein
VGATASFLTDTTQASCFYHPQKQAVHVCDGCGRLVCALCSVDLADQHLCPACISSGKKKGKLTVLENTRVCWDRIALSLGVIGLFTSFFSIITAPIAIYISIRHWNSPSSLVRPRKRGFVIAVILAVLELVFWVGILTLAFMAPRHHR